MENSGLPTLQYAFFEVASNHAAVAGLPKSVQAAACNVVLRNSSMMAQLQVISLCLSWTRMHVVV